MSLTYDNNSLSSASSNKSRVVALETTLQQSLVYFKELLLDIEDLHSKIEEYKNQLIAQTEKCERENCCSSEKLKKVIESKDNIIQLVASSLTKLNETKDLSIIKYIFKIIFGDTKQPVIEKKELKCEKDIETIKNISFKKEVIEPKIEKQSTDQNISITEDISFNESVCEIEGTPTGRTSPIIESRRLRSTTLVKSSDFRDKKKCPDTWSTPENKSIKLTYPTPTSKTKGNGRLRQSKISLVKLTQSCVVDLTSSPEFAGGVRSRTETYVQPLVKKESVENDDTILLSLTSGPVNFKLLKSTLTDSPCKFKKPSLCLKSKDKDVKVEPKDIVEDVNNIDGTEHSLIMDPLPKICHTPPKKKSPMKREQLNDEDVAYDNNESISLLKRVNCLDNIAVNTEGTSPHKRPLRENINITNIPMDTEMEASISLLRPELKCNMPDNEDTTKIDSNKRRMPELVEPVYKEPTVRTKAEKRALKGWSCDECKNFFGELYKNDPVMLAKKIEECSKHRGRNNPIRPKTPPGFWNPRWEVPENTEEFNRMNNAQ